MKLISKISIKNKIFVIHDKQVMLDEDLAFLYKIETKVFNQSLKRNMDRFPNDFCFRLTKSEYQSLRSQFVTSNSRGGRRYLPFVFTEQGVAMLSAILKSETAVKVSIQIMNAFVEMRKYINENYQLYQKVKEIEKEQIIYGIKTDKRFDQIFKAIASTDKLPKQKIFFDGQIFDAHKLVSDIIRSAKNRIILIDNFVDDTVLPLFNKRAKNVDVVILTKTVSSDLLIDVKKYNQQFPKLEVKQFDLSHDRFLIVDDSKIYHFGASLKDLGKKWFAVSLFDNKFFELTKKLKDYR